MRKPKFNYFNLSTEEKELLQEVFYYFIENKLKADKEGIYRFTDYAKECGAIADSGEKYVKNRNVWEIRGEILAFHEKKKDEAIKLRNSLLRNELVLIKES